MKGREGCAVFPTLHKVGAGIETKVKEYTQESQNSIKSHIRWDNIGSHMSGMLGSRMPNPMGKDSGEKGGLRTA